MSSVPFDQIPDSTQVHVDRLLRSEVEGHRVVQRTGDGRFGTLYLAEHLVTGKKATLEVLRSELVGSDDDVRAINAIKCTGVANVTAFGEVPDGRRFRLLEHLQGESLAQLVSRAGPLSVLEAAKRLSQVATVLEAAHAWRITHGGLDATAVLVVGDDVKVIDFGLAKQRDQTELDVLALGTLGIALRHGLDATQLPAQTDDLDEVLRDFLDERVKSATSAKQDLERFLARAQQETTPADRVGVAPPPAPPPLSAPSPRRRGGRRVFAMVLVALAAAIGGSLWYRSPAPEPEPEPELDLGEADEPDLAEPSTATLEPAADAGPAPTPRPTQAMKRARAAPSAEALQKEIVRLERTFHQTVRPGDDVEQALFVLNKQRLRLTGNPSEQDRRDVAAQLAGWRRSYLRR